MNALLGGVLGLLLAVVSLWILLAAMEVFTPMLASDMQAQMEDALRQSTLAGPWSTGTPWTSCSSKALLKLPCPLGAG